MSKKAIDFQQKTALKKLMEKYKKWKKVTLKKLEKIKKEV